MEPQQDKQFAVGAAALGAAGGAVISADSPFSLAGKSFDYVPVDTTTALVVVVLPPIGSPAAPFGRVINVVKLTTSANVVTLRPGQATDAIDFTGVVNVDDSTLLGGAAIQRVQLQACSIGGVNRWMPLAHSLVA